MKAEITDLQVVAELARQSINKDDVTVQRDYCAKYPSTTVYRIKNSKKRIAVLSKTPFVNESGQSISAKWLWNGSSYVSDTNLFGVVVKGAKVNITYKDKKSEWNPDVFLDDVEKSYIGTWLLSGSMLELNYGICKRQLVLRRGMILEYYIFDKDPKGEVRIKSNYEGDITTRKYWAIDGKHRPLKGFETQNNEKIITAKVFEQAVYPITVDDSVEFTSASDDGYLLKDGGDYDTTHDTTNADDVIDGITNFACGQAYDGEDYRIYRAALFFDTSSIPDDAEISEAVLSLYFESAGDPTDSDYVVQQFTGNQPLQVSDYNAVKYVGDLGSIDSDDVNENAYNNITLNETGIGIINKTGTTKLGLRSSRDIDDVAPGEDDEACAEIKSSESGSSTEPKLIITYTAGMARPLVDGSLADVGLVNGVLVR